MGRSAFAGGRDALDLITRRKTSFWSLYTGEYQLRWTLLELAAQLLLTAGRIETELKSVRKDAKAMLEAYTTGIPGAGGEPALPWCMVDRYHRHLEHRYALLDLHLERQHTQLETVMAAVRRRYMDVGRCAERLAEALVTSGFEVEGPLRQDEVFRRQVRQRATEGKMAYLLGCTHGPVRAERGWSPTRVKALFAASVSMSAGRVSRLDIRHA